MSHQKGLWEWLEEIPAKDLEQETIITKCPTGFRIDHRTMKPYLRRLEKEPYFQMGSRCPPAAWYRRQCWLVLALGELAEDGLKTLALCGHEKPIIIPIPKNARFIAHGLEGACIVRKPLFNALMNLRDLIPEYRGYIICDERPS